MKRNNQVIFRPSLLLVCASFLLPNTVTAQRVSTCEELGLRPIEPGTGNDLLRLLLETDKFPERGCLVHHHPNGKDYVITPADWGESPVDRHRILIDDAMNAITVSRDKYVQYGTLNSALFYIFDNVSRGHVAGTTFWLIGNACWMVSGVPYTFGLTRPGT